MSIQEALLAEEQTAAGLPAMQVRKRDGSLEPVDVGKIVRAVERCSGGLPRVDPMRVATRTISGLCDGSTTRELDDLSIRTAAALIAEEPEYSRLAARLLLGFITKEVRGSQIMSFSQSIAAGHAAGVINDTTAEFVARYARKLDDAINALHDLSFEFFGLRTVYDRYLLRDPVERTVIEMPQYFLLRVACGLSQSPDEAIALYEHMASFDYLPSSPTLFNSGTAHSQLSSCYLVDSPADELGSIYDTYGKIAQLSKFAGGIGLAFHRVRSQGSLIRGTNGLSNGIIPFLKTLDASVAAVNQGGRRKGAACVYLETWHADIEDFLELRDNTGDEARRAHHLNLANWVPDLFMDRVENDWMWSLFDPKEVPELCDLHGPAFEAAYTKAEKEGRYVRQVKARDLYARMMRTLAETGNGWMTFKDAANRTCNQAAEPQNVVHLSNLCTEILEVTDAEHTAVCNLGSLNLGRFVADGRFDFGRLGDVVRLVVPFLDRVIDINYYPTPEAERSNDGWRPIGLGVMGLQDAFFKLRLPFDSPEARALSKAIQEEIYASALEASAELAAVHGPHARYSETHAARGKLQPDLWGVEPSDPQRWERIRARVAEVGLRNSLLIAIAPTATIASIVGSYECTEPQVSNLFKRETLSGEFLQINSYLVRDLQKLGLWNDATIGRLVADNGSVQGLDVPDDIRALYRTAWEIPMRSLIDMAAERSPFIDQSQSLNLFVEQPSIGKLSSMYLHAWKSGLKTTYYLRSRPASKIKTTSTTSAAGTATVGTVKTYTDSEAITCSLENPETCEACD
ncbi:MAG: ribonucleoside-diphosphate reductase subunit alpha [Acidimicrobiales bacterium]|nr:ribonucleoside-diphosphate reductase subunit alpha [Acidimicrobiales bacterium]